MQTRNRTFAPHVAETEAQACQAGGCAELGLYKAPRSPSQLHEYQWFCLEHVQEYNRKWDFFEQMDGDEIEAFMKDAMTGHRPTWARDMDIGTCVGASVDMLNDALERFLSGGGGRIKQIHDRNERNALAQLGLEDRCGIDELKAAYRKLVKQIHPDLHKGDKAYEEQLKKVTEAYVYLRRIYA